jgi:hypothetical protein
LSLYDIGNLTGLSLNKVTLKALSGRPKAGTWGRNSGFKPVYSGMSEQDQQFEKDWKEMCI